MACSVKLSDILDPVFFIESCLFIVDKDSKKVPFLLKAIQRAYLAARTTRDIILKSRKLGFSTLILALWVHACLTRQNTKAVIVSHDKDSAKRLLERLKYMLENSIYPINYRETADGVKFPDTNSSIWIGTAGSRNFGRGDDITHGLLSEQAFYEHQNVLTSVGEALTNDAWLVIESTANGAGTPHHELWLRSKLGENSFKPHFFPWFSDPECFLESPSLDADDEEKRLQTAFNLNWGQLAWRRRKMREMADRRLFMQEYPAHPEEAFLATGRMIFEWDAVKAQEDNRAQVKWRGILKDAGTEFKIEPLAEGPLMVWRTRDPRVDYLLTFDSADGIPGMDYSVADVWDTRTWEQVAQWRGYCSPEKFGAEVCYGLGQLYGWAVIAGEVNPPGNAVYLALKNKGYPNLWMDPSSQPSTVGFRTTVKSKPILVTDLRASLTDMVIRLNSIYTISELKTFCVLDDSGTMGAQSGCHDDTVITAGIAAYILKRWALEPDQKRRSQLDHVRGRRSARPPRHHPGGGGGSLIV